MNLNELENAINKDILIKKQVFINYIDKYLSGLNNEKSILFVSDHVNFLNGEQFFIMNDQPISKLINTFETNMLLYEQYKIDINTILNENINTLQTYLDNLKFPTMNKYHYCKQIEFVIFETERNNYSETNYCINIFLNDQYFTSLNISCVDIYNYNNMIENRISIKITSLLCDKTKELIKKEFDDIIRIRNTNYKICYDKNLKDKINVVDKWIDRAIYVPLNVITNKLLYESIKFELENYSERNLCEYFLKEFEIQFKFQINDNINSDYDLINGYMKSSFQTDNFVNIKKLCDDVRKQKNKYENLKTSKIEDDMEEFEFMGCVKISKIKECIIDGDNYSIYNHKYKRKNKNVFFKNGKRVGRYSYHKISRLLGFGKVIKIYNNNTDDWFKISKQALTEEEIDMYADKLNWSQICVHRPLSQKMLLKHADKIDWPYVLSNRRITDLTLEKLAPIIGWSVISRYSKYMSEKFITNHLYDIDLEQINQNPCHKYISDIADKLSNLT